MPLFNCKIELDLSLSKNFIRSEMSRTAAVAVNPLDPVRAATETTGATFQINSTKLYVYVVTLSINDNIKILENLMDVYWDKYRSEITTQLRNSILNYMIDPTFTNIYRLFVLSFKKSGNDAAKSSFDKYYMPLVEIKDSNALIDNKLFFDKSIKSKQEAYKKLIEISKNDNYTTSNLLDYSNHQHYSKLIDIDLSRQTNTNIP